MDEGKDTTELKKAVGAAIEAARSARGWTQQKLADEVKCSVETISNAERHKSLPGVATFLEIARALELDLSSLVPASAARRNVSRARHDLEAEAQRHIRTLDDRHLGYLVKMASVFTD